MPTNDQWDFSDENDQNQQNQQNQGNGLRAQLERALSEIKTLKDSNSALTKQVREATISSHIKEKGLNPKIAKLIPTDVENTKEALDKWFEENADLFPAPVSTEGQGDAQTRVAEDEDPERAMEAEQMDRMADVANSGRVPQRQEDLMAKLRDPNLTQEKLLEIIAAAGGGYGSG